MKANALIASTALPLLVAACSSAPKERPKHHPTPVERVQRPVRPVTPPVSAPPAPSDWRDQPRTPGDWRWAEQNLGPAHDAGFSTKNFRSIAVYSLNRDNQLFALTCNRGTREIEIALGYTVNAALPAGPIIVRTTSTTLPLAIDQEKSKGGWLIASLASSNPLIDAMAFSRGRFMVETGGTPPLYLPSWPEISRVAEDCR